MQSNFYDYSLSKLYPKDSPESLSHKNLRFLMVLKNIGGDPTAGSPTVTL